jgi:ribonuclease J
MVRNMTIAQELGYLQVPEGVLIDMKGALELPDDRVVFMSTGSQGEPMAVLSRIASHDHQIDLGPGDTVVLASSLIPGNESAVFRMIDRLTELDAEVVHTRNANVHVSGHATAGELLYCYNIVQPRNVMPVHGEERHLRANADLAIKSGVAPELTHLTHNGTVLDLRDGVARVVGQVEVGFVYVDGSTVGEITDADLKDRRILSDEGFISIFVAVDGSAGRMIVGPEIQARGFAEDDSVFDEVRPLVAKALEHALEQGVHDTVALSQEVRRTVGRWVNTSYRRRPMIIPVVVEA